MHLDGSVRAPRAGGNPQQLVVLLHGVAATGDGVIDLADGLAGALPHALFLAPDAPFPCDLAPYGRQWFSLQDRSAELLAQGARTAGAILNGFVDRQLAQYGLDDRNLALVGFSQGAMMTLWLAPRRERACGAAVGFAGALVDGHRLQADLKSRPPILLCHGDADLVVDVGCLDHAAQGLRQAGLDVSAKRIAGLGHDIDDHALSLASRFLQECLA